MNRLSHNPNIRRFGLPLTVTAALLAACTAESGPTPTPSETTASAASRPVPSCAVKAEVNGKTATFIIDAKDEEQPGVYAVEKVEYEYGDGLSDAASGHIYAKAGSYTIRASMIMDVAPGVEVGAPFRDGFAVPCTPTTATIG